MICVAVSRVAIMFRSICMDPCRTSHLTITSHASHGIRDELHVMGPERLKSYHQTGIAKRIMRVYQAIQAEIQRVSRAHAWTIASMSISCCVHADVL